jgi:hypothetical protein
MYIKSIFNGAVMNSSCLIGAAYICTVLSVMTFPAKASTISGSQVNVYVGYETSSEGLVTYDPAGFASISNEVEYPDYWVASHDIDDVSPGSGVISFQTDNSPLASQAQFADCCLFNGFIYEFPELSPTLLGIDVAGLAWGYYDLEPLVISVDFQTSIPIPAAIWLFGSGLIGLTGVARIRKA